MAYPEIPSFNPTLSNQIGALNQDGADMLQKIMAGQGPTNLSTDALLKVLQLGQQAYKTTPEYDMSGFMNAYVNPYMNSNNRQVYDAITNFLANMATYGQNTDYANMAAQRANIANAGGHIGQLSNMMNTLGDLASNFSLGSVAGLQDSWNKVREWLNPKLGSMSAELWAPAANLYNQIATTNPEAAGNAPNLPGNINGLSAYAVGVLQDIANNYKSRMDRKNNLFGIANAGSALSTAGNTGDSWNSAAKNPSSKTTVNDNAAWDRATSLDQIKGLRSTYKTDIDWLRALNKNQKRLKQKYGNEAVRGLYKMGGI